MMAEQTNAQAALQAAATIHSGRGRWVSPAEVKTLAESLKNWLDAKDRDDRA